MAPFRLHKSNAGGWIQTALSVLQNISVILLALLGPMFAPPKAHFQNPYNESHFGRGNNSFFSESGADPELLAAYEFFHLERGKCTEDDLNKQWKFLSRKHHPDRNSQSRESVEMTQKLNHYKDLILKEDFSNDKEEDNEMHNSDDDDYSRNDQHQDESEQSEEIPPRYSRNTYQSEREKKRQKGRFQRKKKQKRKQQCKDPCYDDFYDYDDSYFDEHAQYRSQMKEFMDNMRKVKEERERLEIGLRALRSHQKRDIKRDKKNNNLYDQHKGIDTSTEEGRDKAHAIWMQSRTFSKDNGGNSRDEVPPATRASTSSLDDIDDEVDDDIGKAAAGEQGQNNPAASDNEEFGTNAPENPINLTMEQCTHKIAVSLRLGLHDTAAKMLGMACSQAAVRYRVFHDNTGDVYKAVQELLEGTLDNDENTLWHYAAYYESDKLLSALLAMYSHAVEANEDSKLLHPTEPLTMMLKENIRGQIPQDFLPCSPATYMYQRVRNLTDMARTARKENTLEHRVLAFVKNVDIFAILYSWGMYLFVCRHFFGCGRLLSFVVCFAQSKLEVEEPRERIIYTMLLLGLYRVSIRPCLAWIRYFFWTTWTSLFVSLLAVYVLKKLKATKLLLSIAAWLNFSIIQIVGFRVARFSDWLDAELLAKLTRRNKWLASHASVNGLFYLVVYCALYYMAQTSIQYIWSIAYTSVFGKRVMDGATPLGFGHLFSPASQTEQPAP